MRKLCELQDAGTARRIAPALAWCVIAVGLAAGPALLSRVGQYVGNKASTSNVALQVVGDSALCPPNTEHMKKPLCVVVAWSSTQVATRWVDADNGQFGAQVSITTQPRSLTGYQHLFPAIHPPVPIK